jgi:hypothetical protein
MLWSLFFSYENENKKKMALTMEFPMTTIDSSSYPFYALKSHSLDALLNYGISTIQKNGTLSPLNGSVFNIT